ncbi:MAG: NAD(P)/FAD-dependent oxidoreductase [Candidatus Woesearchaeota archaeon]
MKIGIIGGGIAGLSAGYYLSKKGHTITIFEPELGGLARAEGTPPLEPYYHHFFLSDKDLINLLHELKLENKIFKKQTPMGFYVNKKLYSFNSPIDLLKFKPLNIIDRLKLGIMMIYFQKKKDCKNLDTISVKNWMKKIHGEKIYKTVWKPLLIAKFTKNAENIPASWLWGRINPRSKSRERLKEYLYYPQGSFNILSNALMKNIEKKRGIIIKQKVTKIIVKNKNAIKLETANNSYSFDKYIITIPNPVFSKLVKLPTQYRKNLENIEYQEVICMTLYLKNNLTKFYWININDKKIPFSGLIEHTNFIDKKYYKNKNIIYLFNYVHHEHSYLKKSDEEILKLYISGLKHMFPGFKESSILHYKVNRAKYATPIYDMNYLKKKPAFITPIKNIFLLNTSQIYPEDRNTSHGIMYAKKLVELITESKIK